MIRFMLRCLALALIGGALAVPFVALMPSK